MTTSTNGEMSQEERDKRMSKAYTSAQKDLREAHQDEFNGYYQARAAEQGIDWTPRLSKEDKALAEIEKLLTDNPSLAEKLAARLAAAAAKV